MTERLRWRLIAFMVVVWGVVIATPIFVRDFKPPPEAHVAFMTVIGILAAPRSSSGQEEKEESPP